jgi:hypothetical protein
MIVNHLPSMFSLKNQTVLQFGKDSTGTIDYTFNSQGFRSNYDFDFVPDYAFFGCSLVFGIGVGNDEIFASRFDRSHNYGVADVYNNNDIFLILQKFLASDLYHPSTKISVIWHSRNADVIPNYVNKLSTYNIIHFFCGTPLPFKNCYPAINNLDFDVSGTHIGEKTHKFYHGVLKSLFAKHNLRV